MPDDPEVPETPPIAAADKPAGRAPGEPLKGEVSRTDSPGAGASATAPADPRTEPPAPKPENPAAAQTATTSETSSATGQPTATSAASGPEASVPKPAADTTAQDGTVVKPPVPAAARPPAGASAKPTPAAAKPLGGDAAKASPAAKAAAAAGAPPAAKAPHVPAPPPPPSGPPDPPPPADKMAPVFITSLQNAISGGVTHVSYWVGDWTIVVPVEQFLAVARQLRDAADALFDFCSDVTATDWPPRADGRFDVVYCLYSTRLRHRIRVKVKAKEGQPVPSVTEIWPAANWLEREVYDMFGVNFVGHPDRRRILMPEDWQGFPQRKDYPLEGPGELLMENPLDWLKLRQAREEADIE